MSARALGEVRVNRFRAGAVTNDFSAMGIVSALGANGIGVKKMFSDIGIMQKFTARAEQGERWFYTGTYSGDFKAIIRSPDFITWEYVSQPDFPNLSKWENATYVLGNKCYYFVRQYDTTPYGFLTAYDLENRRWERPVLLQPVPFGFHSLSGRAVPVPRAHRPGTHRHRAGRSGQPGRQRDRRAGPHAFQLFLSLRPVLRRRRAGHVLHRGPAAHPPGPLHTVGLPGHLSQT